MATGAIVLAARTSLAPVRRFRDRLEARSAQDLSPVPADDLPSEIAPVATTLNGLLERLEGAFDAERSFAANAAHEIRTPLAGASHRRSASVRSPPILPRGNGPPGSRQH